LVDVTESPLTSRRGFLAAAGLSGLALASPSFASHAPGRRITGYPFTLGVASGDPLPRSVALWTRLAPAPLSPDGGMAAKRFPVRWQVAEDERFRRVVRQGQATAAPELGHSVHVEAEGLRPGREYFYRFRAGGEESPVGRTRTALAPGARPRRMLFAFASCQQFEHGYFTAYRHMAEEDLDLVIHLGDYIYEYGPNDYRAPEGNVRLHEGPETITLGDYRRRYAQYRSDPDLQAAHARFPWMVTWDDHEVDNNWADEVPEDGQPPEAFLRRRRDAFQAYYENMPLRPFRRPRGIDLPLYRRRLPFGDLATFNVLDTRQYRSNQVCGDGVGEPRLERSCPQRAAPERSITGDEQMRWLLDGLGRSRSTWNVLAQQVFFAQQDFAAGPEEVFNMDAWDGYVASRERILDFVARRQVANPIVLTGDVHANWASNLKADFDDPDSATLGSEFVGTSITSQGDGFDIQDPQRQILAENPHIKFYNGQRGYVRCTVGRESWRTDYRVVPYVKRPGAPIDTRASFVVEAGNPGLQPA